VKVKHNLLFVKNRAKVSCYSRYVNRGHAHLLAQKEPAMSNKIKRRKYIIDRQQYKISAIIVFYNILGIFLTALLVFLPSFIVMSTSAGSPQEAEAAREILVLHKRFWPAIIVVSVILATHSLFFFHKLFGPLYRFKKTLQDVTKGDLSYNINLREKDFLTTEKDIINDMISSLRNGIAQMKQDAAFLADAIAQLETSLEGDQSTQNVVRQRLKNVKETSDKVSQGLNNFKIS
jgi:methyl-accepting chemotaxis protein